MPKLSPLNIAIMVLLVIALLEFSFWLGLLWGQQAGSPVTAFSPNSTITPDPPATPLTPSPTSPGAAPTPVAYGVVTSTTLNIRRQPGTAAALAGNFSYGDIVPLFKRENGWYQTSDGNWVSAIFMEIRKTRAEAESYQRELKS